MASVTALSAPFNSMDNMATITRVRSSSGQRMLKRLFAGMVVLAFAVPAFAGVVEDEALRDAISDLDVAGVKGALKNGANPNSSARDRLTPLEIVTNATLVGISNPSPADKKRASRSAKLSTPKLSKLLGCCSPSVPSSVRMMDRFFIIQSVTAMQS